MPCARSRSAKVAISVHADFKPRRLGRLQLVVPALLVQPGLRLGAKPRLDPSALDVRPIPLGAGDDLPRIDPALERRVEFQPRGLFRIRKFATVRIDPPKRLKLAAGAL